MSEAYIAAATRTAGGRKGGKLSGWHPADMAGAVLDDLLRRVDADPDQIEDVIMGCVYQLGEQASNIARNAVLASGLPDTVPGTSIDRQCGSSQQALHFAAQAVKSDAMDIVIAAGVESMSRVPIGLSMTLPQKHGFGYYISPKMERRYPGVIFNQFTGGELMAEKYELDRETLDAFAYNSHLRAIHATEQGMFKDEILPLPVLNAEGEETGETHDRDEGIRFDVNREAMSAMEPLAEGGRLTAATASQICDGASGLLVVSERGLKALGVEPLARIHQMTVVGSDPVIMLEGPIPGTNKALARAGMSINDIDLFEVNEAFASIPVAWLRATGAAPERLNTRGGAIALGHPLGSSGTKLMTTLVHSLRQERKRYGLQAICEGGGLANVTIVERL
ncbi:MAG: acetyl-CoA C-acetyltransferase [Ectothiorhodospiraceae bacterium]|nr:acetyl-CoA C-acetyltransferase [Ectothiorhodospiraceae bacterium]